MPNGDGKTPEQRFTERYTIDPETGCWNWIGCINCYGYGVIAVKRKIVHAHRFSYQLLRGKIPNGLTIDHLCRNRKCVNPNHLEAVSAIENVMRGIGVGATNSRKTSCIRGHPLSGGNLVIKKNGRRKCRICSLEEDRRFRQKQRKKP